MAGLTAALAFGSLQAAPSSGGATPTWKINMKEAEIRQLIEQVADITGYSFVVDPRVKGKVTVISNTEMNQEEILQMFESVLKVHNFSTVRTGKMVKIVPTQGAKQDTVPLEEPDASSDKMITQVIPVTYANATELVPILRPEIPQYGHLAAVTSSNALIISDHSANVQRMIDIVKQIDKESNEEVDVIQLKNAWVGDLVKVLDQITGGGKGQAAPAQGAANTRVRVFGDERANRLILKGEKSARQKLRVLVADLDRPAEHSVTNSVIYLKYASAVQVADVLRGVITGQASGGAGSMGLQSGFGGQAMSRGTGLMGNSGGSFGSGNSGSTLGGTGLDASGGLGGTGSSMTGFGNQGNRRGMGAQPIQAGNVTIQADEALNALVVRAGPSEMAEITKLIKDLDVRRPQVLIEAAIVEVRGDSGQALGVQFGKASHNQLVGGTNFSNAGLSLQNILTAASDPKVAAQSGVSLGNGMIVGGGTTKDYIDANGNPQSRVDFGLVIQAINTASNTNLLSTPSIMTLDNEEAEILVGQNVPFLVGTQQTATGNPFNTVERKDVGVSLKVIPQVNDGDTIRLRVIQEASSLSSTANIKTTDVVTDKRMINTSILARDGQVIVLGGLMSDSVIDTLQKVPLLGDIPLLGALFRSHGTTQQKSNLLLFLRPTVVRDDAGVESSTARKYDIMRSYRVGGEESDHLLDTQHLLDRDPGAVLNRGVRVQSGE